MKKYILSLLATVLISAISLKAQDQPVNSGQGSPEHLNFPDAFIVYEQMFDPGPISLASQNFEPALNVYDCQGADDFFISSYHLVDQVEVLGIYYNGWGGPAESVNIWFYTDNSGLPGSIISQHLNVIPTGGLNTGSFVIPLSPPAVLYPGIAWVSVQANMDFSIGGQWGWTEHMPFNSPSAWRNPGGGFLRPCADWGPRVDTCNFGQPPYKDFSFRLAAWYIPIEMISFTAAAYDNLVELSWITATETNNQGFEVQRKSGGEFETLTFVEGYGTTTETHTYSYSDRNVNAGRYSYRLKQIDFDGTFEYSNIVEVDVPAPAAFALEQNYPNPFNPTTKIKYTVPFVETHRDASLLVTLKVFDILGNEVATLVNEEQTVGTYEVEFSASSDIRQLGSGIYFYQLKAGDYIETKKMILLK